jgi:protein translocase SecG subunit
VSALIIIPARHHFALILIFAVLLQSGKAADLAQAQGGDARPDCLQGPWRSANLLLTKVTTAAAILFR